MRCRPGFQRTEQGRFLERLQSTSRNRVPVSERHLAGRHLAQLTCYSVVDFVSEHQVPEHILATGRSEIDILEEHLVDMALDIPPAPRFLTRGNGWKERLGLTDREIGGGSLQCHHPV